MIFRIIEFIRQKPIEARKRFVSFIAISVMVVVGILWFIFFLSRLAGRELEEIAAPAPAPKLSDTEANAILPPYQE